MTWALIFVAITFSTPDQPAVAHAEPLGQYETMIGCFEARAQALHNLGSTDGYPPKNTQLVCINLVEPNF